MVDRLASELIEAIFSDDGEHRVGLSPAKLRQIVRRLLTAMREPNDMMIRDGVGMVLIHDDPEDDPSEAARDTWQVMVDAALKD